jgi:predicted RND superfamily exporter protein
MFPESSRTNSDMRWFEAHVGPIATVEVLVHFRDGSRESLLNQVRWIQAIDDSLEENQTVGGVFSVATFIPNWPKGSNVRAAVVRSVLKNRIDSGLEEFASKGLVHMDSEGRTWRLMAKVSAVSKSSYGEMTESIRKTVMDTMQSEPDGTSQKPDNAEFTGLSPVMNDTQIALLQDLGLSFLSAFLLITPVMMWMVSSIRGGLLIMLPNIFPVTFAFGMMGWLGLSLDIAGILTASVALGIAVDDTLHFVSWYKRELDAGLSRLEAVKQTYVACGNAMLHTTIISCSAMIPFMFSEFIPTGQFAKLMVVMLVGAIVGDLVMLPALLLSPLGKVIASRNKSTQTLNGAA